MSDSKPIVTKWSDLQPGTTYTFRFLPHRESRERGELGQESKGENIRPPTLDSEKENKRNKP